MPRHTYAYLSLAVIVSLVVYLTPSVAQEGGDAPRNEQNQAEQPSADDVLEELLRRRSENPLIEPARPRREQDSADREGASARLLTGIAPGMSDAKLRREGQFIITRRGRMVRAPGGDATGWVFVFDADASGMQEPPMYLMPCQLLEDMEAIVDQHGDRVVFVLSGQIYLYRGANYLMPTLMKLAPSRGNLQ